MIDRDQKTKKALHIVGTTDEKLSMQLSNALTGAINILNQFPELRSLLAEALSDNLPDTKESTPEDKSRIKQGETRLTEVWDCDKYRWIYNGHFWVCRAFSRTFPDLKELNEHAGPLTGELSDNTIMSADHSNWIGKI